MFSLDPEKLFIVLVVALILLGPDKLPRLARQLASGWSKIRAFQQRVEAEVRDSIPDLPSSQQLVQLVRSPVAYLNSMSASVGDARTETEALAPKLVRPPETRNNASEDPHNKPSRAVPTGLVEMAEAPDHQFPADPGMN
ncbi:MAG: Sec-independent protein translocase subunit TatA/TatB [Acidimicrobiales bacterium]